MTGLEPSDAQRAKDGFLTRARNEFRSNPVGTLGAVLSLAAIVGQNIVMAYGGNSADTTATQSNVVWLIKSYPVVFVAAFISRIAFVADAFMGWSLSVVLAVGCGQFTIEQLQIGLFGQNRVPGELEIGYASVLAVTIPLVGVMITFSGVVGSAMDRYFNGLRENAKLLSGKARKEALENASNAVAWSVLGWITLVGMGVFGLNMISG